MHKPETWYTRLTFVFSSMRPKISVNLFFSWRILSNCAKYAFTCAVIFCKNGELAIILESAELLISNGDGKLGVKLTNDGNGNTIVQRKE